MERGLYGTIAMAEIKLEPYIGVRKIMAHSLFRDDEDWIAERSKRAFETKRVNHYGEIDRIKGWDRRRDPIAKIFEEIHANLQGKADVSGEIHLFSERKPCVSCNYVMYQFKQIYPAVQIVFYHHDHQLNPTRQSVKDD